MKEFKYTINGNKYEVAVGDTTQSSVEVVVNGEKYTVELEQKVEKPRPQVQAPVIKKSADASVKKETLNAPLPGTIIEVKVKVGDEIKEGQTLVVLDAMKMENNLDAEKDGKIAEILVQPGEAVMENTPLVVFE